MPSPTQPPPPPDSLNSALRRNIAALEQRRRETTASASRSERLADAITRFTGSMIFVALHLVIYGAWIAADIGVVPGWRGFDPNLNLLAMEASVEAIFLSTFVLISQNRMARTADERADLDLHVSLLAEHELTKLAGVVGKIAERLGIPASHDPEIQELQRDVAPEAVLDEIAEHQAET